MKLSSTILGLMIAAGITACTTPEGTVKLGEVDVNMENAEAIGEKAIDTAMNNTSYTQAVNSLAKYCRMKRINVASVQKALKADGFLSVGERKRDNVEVFMHPDGRPVMGTATGNGKQPGCVVMMAKDQAQTAPVDALLRKKMFSNLERLPFKLPKTAGAWIVDGNDKNLIILVKDRKSAGIAYITG